ncbi:hypothetical protein OROMI_030146 [Orobanche minor]
MNFDIQKSPRNGSVWHFCSKLDLDVPSNIVQKKIVARIMVFKIRPSQEILKIRDGTPLEPEEILTYRKKPSKWIVARILVFKIRPSHEILKIHDGTPLEAKGILTYIKRPRNRSVWHFSIKLDIPSNVVQNKRVAWILGFKIRPSQEILKIRDGTPLEPEEILTYRKKPSKWIVARILVFKIRPSKEILKIRDGTPLEPEEILTYRKKPSKWIVQKKRVARILVFKIRPSQEILKIPLEMDRPSQKILKIRDGTPLEAEGILTYRKSPRNGSVWHFCSKLDVPSNVVQNKRVARIMVFKIRPSQEILKIRDITPLEAKGILTYRKKKIVARIMVFKIRPSQEILKIRDGTPLEPEEILTYRKKPSKWIVARILVFKIRPSHEILKIHDGTPLEAKGILTYIKRPRNRSVWHFYIKLDIPSNVVQNKRVAWILGFKIRPSQEILKIRDGTPLEPEEILTYRKKPSKWIVARILVFKIRPSKEILKIRDGTPLEPEEILTYRKKPSKWIDAISRNSKNSPSQKILKIRDGTPLEAEGILTYRKSPRNGSVWHFCSKLDVPSNVVQNKRVARIMVFKIRPSQEILKIRDITPLEAKGILTYRKKKIVARIMVFKIRPSQEILKIRDVAQILVFKIRPSQEILKIRDITPLEAKGILTYRKRPRNRSVWHFYIKLDIPSNVVQNKRVAWILGFKIRPSQEILKIRDGTPLEPEEILTYRKKPSKWIGLALF